MTFWCETATLVRYCCTLKLSHAVCRRHKHMCGPPCSHKCLSSFCSFLFTNTLLLGRAPCIKVYFIMQYTRTVCHTFFSLKIYCKLHSRAMRADFKCQQSSSLLWPGPTLLCIVRLSNLTLNTYEEELSACNVYVRVQRALLELATQLRQHLTFSSFRHFFGTYPKC